MREKKQNAYFQCKPIYSHAEVKRITRRNLRNKPFRSGGFASHGRISALACAPWRLLHLDGAAQPPHNLNRRIPQPTPMATIQSIAGENEQHPDVALVERVRAGDVSAYDELVRKYDRQVFRIAQHITQNREDAEDVMQDAFLKAYEKLDQFQGNSKFYTWLVRIAVNESLMRLRKRRTGKMVSIDEDIDTDEGSVPRDLADWAPDPEQNYTQTELTENPGKDNQGAAPGLQSRLRVARRTGTFYRRHGGGPWLEYSGGQVTAVTRPLAVARTPEPLLPQKEQFHGIGS